MPIDNTVGVALALYIEMSDQADTIDKVDTKTILSKSVHVDGHFDFRKLAAVAIREMRKGECDI